MQSDEVYDQSRSMVNQLQNRLRGRADPSYAEWYRHNVKPTAPVRGVRMQDLRHLVMAWHHDWQVQQQPPISSNMQVEVTFLLFHAEHVDDRLAAMVFLDEVLIPNFVVTPDLLPRLSTLFPPALISDFKACDHFAAKVLQPLLIRYGSQVSDHLRTWFTAESVWQARAALSALTPLASDAIHDELLFAGCKIVLERQEEEAKSIVGSALRALGKVRPELVESFLSDSHNLVHTNAACLNKATQFLEGRRQTHFREQRRLLLAWNSQMLAAPMTCTLPPPPPPPTPQTAQPAQPAQPAQTPTSTTNAYHHHIPVSSESANTPQRSSIPSTSIFNPLPRFSNDISGMSLPHISRDTTVGSLLHLPSGTVSSFAGSGIMSRDVIDNTQSAAATTSGLTYTMRNEEVLSFGPNTSSANIQRAICTSAIPIHEVGGSYSGGGISSTFLPVTSTMEPQAQPVGTLGATAGKNRMRSSLTGVAHGRITRSDSGEVRRRCRGPRPRSESCTPSSVLGRSGTSTAENDSNAGLSGGGIEGSEEDCDEEREGGSANEQEGGGFDEGR